MVHEISPLNFEKKYFWFQFVYTKIVGSLWSTEVGHHRRTSAKWVCVLISACVCLLELTLYRQEKVLWHPRWRLNQEDQVRFIKKNVWENIRCCSPHWSVENIRTEITVGALEMLINIGEVQGQVVLGESVMWAKNSMWLNPLPPADFERIGQICQPSHPPPLKILIVIAMFDEKCIKTSTNKYWSSGSWDSPMEFEKILSNSKMSTKRLASVKMQMTILWWGLL